MGASRITAWNRKDFMTGLALTVAAWCDFHRFAGDLNIAMRHLALPMASIHQSFTWQPVFMAFMFLLAPCSWRFAGCGVGLAISPLTSISVLKLRLGTGTFVDVVWLFLFAAVYWWGG
jgi:hypothetical protein